MIWPMPAGSGPCETWPLDLSCLCPGWSNNPGEWTPAQRSAVERATELLWRLTAGRYGLCHRIVRPCKRACPTPRHQAGSWAMDGIWVDVPSACGCGCVTACDDCDCGQGPDRITVPGPIYAPAVAPCASDPHHPANRPVQVWIDGELLDPSRYWIQAPNQVVRTDGQRWPQCQDTAVPHNAEGAFAISYWIGHPVPAGGRSAVARLACEIHKSCTGDGSCALPERVQTVAREGITYTMLDPMQHLDEGRTGLADVDMWLATVNPGSIRAPSTVWSPDQAKARREGVRPWR